MNLADRLREKLQCCGPDYPNLLLLPLNDFEELLRDNEAASSGIVKNEGGQYRFMHIPMRPAMVSEPEFRRV